MKIIHPKASTATMAKILLAWSLALIFHTSSILMVSRYLMQISNMPNKFKSLQKILDRFSILGKFQLLPNKNAQIALSLLVGFGLINLTPIVTALCRNKVAASAIAALHSEEPEETPVNLYIVGLIWLLVLTLLASTSMLLCLATGCAASAYAFANSDIFTGAACLIFFVSLVAALSLASKVQESKLQKEENPLYSGHQTSSSYQFNQPTVNSYSASEDSRPSTQTSHPMNRLNQPTVNSYSTPEHLLDMMMMRLL